MARGAGGLRHVGAAAARGARAPPTAAGMLQPATGYSKTRCATARWDLSFIAASLLAAVQTSRGSWLRWMREGLLEDGRRYRYFLPVLQGSSLQKNASGQNTGTEGVARSPLAGDELDIDPRCRRGRKHITHLPSKKSAVSLDKSYWKHAVTAEQQQQYLRGRRRCVGAVYVSKKCV